MNKEELYKEAFTQIAKANITMLDKRSINDGKYLIIIARPFNFLLTYKKEWFLKFGDKFRNEGMTGLGDSLNKEDIMKALDKGCTHVIRIYEKDYNVKMYIISFMKILEKGINWTNKEGKEVMSFSIHEYTLLDNVRF